MTILKQVIHYSDTNSVEATWVDANDIQIKCHSYADVQMDMFRADATELGTSLAEYEGMIAEVEAAIVPYVPPPISVQSITAAMDALFDATAQSRRYDSRLTCALRAGYPGPFQAEGTAFATWMDTCNALGYVMLAEVQAGKRPMPTTIGEALALLPEMKWP